MVAAGFWQLRRLDERRAANEAYAERIEQSPVPIDSLLDEITSGDADAVSNRRVTATGTYDDVQVVLFNRSQGGRAVDNVLSALTLDDRRIVIVNRGAIPVGADPPSPPRGDVTVEGRIRPSEVRQTGELTDADADVLTEVRRVDIDRLSQQFGADAVLPVYLELIASTPATTVDDPVVLDPPQLSEGNHLSYAFQWFIFAGCVLVGWVLAVRRSLATRKAARSSTPARPANEAEQTSRTRPDRPAIGGDESTMTPDETTESSPH